jgi:hypothetical protein
VNRSDYIAEWKTPDPEFLKAVDLWRAYYRACDAFDGTTGPVPPWRRTASTGFSQWQHRQTMQEAMRAGITEDVMKEAKNRALYEYEQETRKERP